MLHAERSPGRQQVPPFPLGRSEQASTSTDHTQCQSVKTEPTDLPSSQEGALFDGDTSGNRNVRVSVNATIAEFDHGMTDTPMPGLSGNPFDSRSLFRPPMHWYPKCGEGRQETALPDQYSNPNVRQSPAAEGATERPLQLRKMINPPKFTATNLETWKREIRFRCELYAAAPENQGMANIGFGGEGGIREIMMEFMTDTKAEMMGGPLETPQYASQKSSKVLQNRKQRR